MIKEEISKTITAMLVDSVKYGFAKSGGVPGYIMLVKQELHRSCTSEPMIIYTSIRIYDIGSHPMIENQPANNPKFVLIVSIERPGTNIYSETTSSALYSEIAGYLLRYYKVPKNN